MRAAALAPYASLRHEGSARLSTKHRLRRALTSVALLGALVGTGVAVAAAAPAHASRDSVAANDARPPGLQGFLPLAEVNKPYEGEVLMRFDAGRVLSVTIDKAKLPPGIVAHVNPDNTIRVSGTPTRSGHFELQVSMTGLTTDGKILTGSSSRELIVSTAVRIDSPGPVEQGVPVSTQLPMTYTSGNVIEVGATGLPDGLSMSPSGLITGTTHETGTFRVTYTAKGWPYGTPPYHAPISTTAAIDMTVAPWMLEIPSSSMPHGYFHQPYSWQLPIQHGSNGLVQVTATGLPPGLTVSPTGLVSGTPGTGDDFPVTFTVTARPADAPWVIQKSVTLTLSIWWH
jgi:hypothetical protein